MSDNLKNYFRHIAVDILHFSFCMSLLLILRSRPWRWLRFTVVTKKWIHRFVGNATKVHAAFHEPVTAVTHVGAPTSVINRHVEIYSVLVTTAKLLIPYFPHNQSPNNFPGIRCKLLGVNYCDHF